MSTSPASLRKIARTLEAHYGEPEPPPVTDPLELILWENVGYLTNDEKRGEAFAVLKERVGTAPSDILGAPPEVLSEVAALGGIHAGKRVEKLLTIAELASDEVDLDRVLQLPPAKARAALKKFPGIGLPGAEKILLFTGSEAVMALESNGLRVLVRLGYGEEQSSYAATYKSVQEAIGDQVGDDCVWLVSVYQLLRRHGMELCRNKWPECASCRLKSSCRFANRDRRRR